MITDEAHDEMYLLICCSNRGARRKGTNLHAQGDIADILFSPRSRTGNLSTGYREANASATTDARRMA